MGRSKAESGEDKHIAVMSSVSKSGLCDSLWLEWIAAVLKIKNKHLRAGPAFCHEDGTMVKSYEMDKELLVRLWKIKQKRPDLLPAEV